MNIKTNEILLLNKIKLGEGTQPQITTQAPVPTEQPQNGMKALMFQARKNIMSDPKLARMVEKGLKEALNTTTPKPTMVQKANGAAGKGVISTLALLTAFGAPLATLTSCQDEPTNIIVPENTGKDVVINVSQSQTVNVDLSALIGYYQDMMNYFKQRDAEQAAQIQQLINVLLEMKQLNEQQALDNKKFQDEMKQYLSVILMVLDTQNVNLEKANAALMAIINGNGTIADKLEQIKALVMDIKSMVAKSLEYQAKAQNDRQTLLAYAKGTYQNSNTLVTYGKKSLESDSLMLEQMNMIIKKLDIIDVDMNSNAEALSKQLGIEFSQLMNMLMYWGYTQTQIQQMTADQIIKAIKENTQATLSNDAKLATIIAMLESGQLTVEQATQQIIELLGTISADVKAILNEVQKTRQEVIRLKNTVNIWGTITASQLNQLNSKADKLVEGQNNIVALINSGITDMNAGFDKVCQTIGMSKDELIAVMMQLGYTQIQVEKMTAGQIIKAINANTAALKLMQCQINNLTQLVAKGQCEEAYRDKIMIELLKNIDANLEDLKTNLVNKYPDISGLESRLDKLINQNDNALCYLNALYNLAQKGVTSEEFNKLLQLAEKNNDKLDVLIELVTKNNILAEKNNTLAKQILDAINKYGIEFVQGQINITDAINNLGTKGEALVKWLEKIYGAILDGNEMSDANAKAILKAIGNIKFDGGNIDTSALEALIKQLIEVEKDNKGLLTSIDGKLDLINATQNVLIDEVKKLAGNLPDYNTKLNTIISLLQGLNNKPGFDDSKILAKLDEMLNKILEHKFCNCNCSGKDDGNHEGILDDLNDILS